MTKYTNPYKQDPVLGPAFIKFRNQASQAKQRGIGWEFTFDQWWAWWQIDNRWARRGNKNGGLVMARKGDVGPYSADNIDPMTHRENNIDYHRNRTRSPPRSRATGREAREAQINRSVDNNPIG